MYMYIYTIHVNLSRVFYRRIEQPSHVVYVIDMINKGFRRSRSNDHQRLLTLFWFLKLFPEVRPVQT